MQQITFCKSALLSIMYRVKRTVIVTAFSV